MTLKAVLDEIDGLDEAIAALYEETKNGDKTIFALAIEGIETHPKVLALKRAHDKTKEERNALRDKVRDAEAKLADLPDDFDPEEYHRLKADAEAAGEGGDDKGIEAKVAARLKIAQDRWERDKTKLEEQVAALSTRAETAETSLRNRIKTDALSTALDAVGVTKPGLRRGALAVHLSRVKIEEEEGADARIVYETEEGVTVDLKEAISHWANSEDGKPYVTPAQGGGAAGGTTGSGGRANPWKRDTLNLTEQARIMRENPTLARRLKSEAGVTA